MSVGGRCARGVGACLPAQAERPMVEGSRRRGLQRLALPRQAILCPPNAERARLGGAPA